jgi:hypothetical protein
MSDVRTSNASAHLIRANERAACHSEAVDVSPSSRSSRYLALSWALVATALFIYCWRDAALDDFSGWIPAVVVFQLPAWWVTSRGADGAALRGRSLVTLFVMTSIFCAPGILLSVGQLAWWISADKSAGLVRSVTSFALLGAAFLLAFGVAPMSLHRALARRPHPLGARKALLGVMGSAVAAMLVTLMIAGPGSPSQAGVWLLLSLPLLWSAPLWLLSRRRSELQPVPRAVARDARPPG